MRLSLKTWTAKKYNLYMIIYNSNLIYCFQNLDNRLDFFSLDLSGADAREIDPLIIFIFDRVFNIVRRSKV